MNEFQLKKLMEDGEELGNKIDDYTKKKIVVKQPEDTEEIKGHIQKAEHNLNFIKDTLEKGYSDWAVVGCYYASYHIALTLILKKGFSSKNHDATLCLLIKYYYKELSKEDIETLNKIYLDNQDILFYVQSKQEREKASYSTKINFDKQIINELRLKTILFVNKCKEILKNGNESEKRKKKKLALFDIDHTLLEIGDSHKKAFAFAFKEVLNIDIDYSNWTLHGYTDLQIIHEFMDKNNIKKDPDKIEKIIAAMIKKFEKENLDHSILLEGVPDILRKLNSNKDVIIGLVTGNIEQIAYTKLKHLKIDEYFILGGFGDSSAIRSDLVETAIKQAGKKFGKINKSNVFIIGDTIHDIKAAKDAGVKVIAVATGTFSFDKLKGKKPDYIFHDLKDTEKIVGVIQNG